MNTNIQPFHLSIPESQLVDLRRRLELTRWPNQEPVDDWSQGVPLAQAKALVEHWQTKYDWRRCEAMLNGFGQFSTEIDGVAIHFLHVRSKHENAMPMILSHGWPGSVIEFHKVIGPLTDPTAHGGRAEDAFHLVIPSLPGFGFSGKPTTAGWGVEKIASVWAELMSRLGYQHYVAQGGDWGALVTTQLGKLHPAGLAAIHVNLPVVLPADLGSQFSAEEAAMLGALQDYDRWDGGYSKQQATRPQTVGYGLADSPSGQAAWIYEKFWKWMDCSGDPLSVLAADEILDNVMLYWLSNSAASSARLYWESFHDGFIAVPLALPVGCSIFAKEIYLAPRSWAERCMSKLIYWNEVAKGGHFAAFEQPGLFVEELRNCFRLLR
ncbi:MAG: epoxide hydrolase [Nevskia sp.]|nr:epoxide hydrolase [Nevskia sp.]